MFILLVASFITGADTPCSVHSGAHLRTSSRPGARVLPHAPTACCSCYISWYQRTGVDLARVYISPRRNQERDKIVSCGGDHRPYRRMEVKHFKNNNNNNHLALISVLQRSLTWLDALAQYDILFIRNLIKRKTSYLGNKKLACCIFCDISIVWICFWFHLWSLIIIDIFRIEFIGFWLGNMS